MTFKKSSFALVCRSFINDSLSSNDATPSYLSSQISSSSSSLSSPQCSCDFRLIIHNCIDSRIFVITNILLIPYCIILLFTSLGLLYYLIRIKKQGFWLPKRIDRGYVRPRPQHVWCLINGGYLLFQIIHSILLLADAYPNIISAEIGNVLPRTFGASFSVMYPLSIAYSTSSFEINPTQTQTTTNDCSLSRQTSSLSSILSNRQSAFIDIFFFFLFIAPFIIFVIFAILTGYYADNGYINDANKYFKVHQFTWLFWGIIYVIVMARVWFKLINAVVDGINVLRLRCIGDERNREACLKMEQLKRGRNDLSLPLVAQLIIALIQLPVLTLYGLNYRSTIMKQDFNLFYFFIFNLLIPVVINIVQWIMIYNILVISPAQNFSKKHTLVINKPHQLDGNNTCFDNELEEKQYPLEDASNSFLFDERSKMHLMNEQNIMRINADTETIETIEQLKHSLSLCTNKRYSNDSDSESKRNKHHHNKLQPKSKHQIQKNQKEKRASDIISMSDQDDIQKRTYNYYFDSEGFVRRNWDEFERNCSDGRGNKNSRIEVQKIEKSGCSSNSNNNEIDRYDNNHYIIDNNIIERENIKEDNVCDDYIQEFDEGNGNYNERLDDKGNKNNQEKEYIEEIRKIESINTFKRVQQLIYSSKTINPEDSQIISTLSSPLSPTSTILSPTFPPQLSPITTEISFPESLNLPTPTHSTSTISSFPNFSSSSPKQNKFSSLVNNLKSPKYFRRQSDSSILVTKRLKHKERKEHKEHKEKGKIRSNYDNNDNNDNFSDDSEIVYYDEPEYIYDFNSSEDNIDNIKSSIEETRENDNKRLSMMSDTPTLTNASTNHNYGGGKKNSGHRHSTSIGAIIKRNSSSSFRLFSGGGFGKSFIKRSKSITNETNEMNETNETVIATNVDEMVDIGSPSTSTSNLSRPRHIHQRSLSSGDGIINVHSSNYHRRRSEIMAEASNSTMPMIFHSLTHPSQNRYNNNNEDEEGNANSGNVDETRNDNRNDNRNDDKVEDGLSNLRKEWLLKKPTRAIIRPHRTESF